MTDQDKAVTQTLTVEYMLESDFWRDHLGSNAIQAIAAEQSKRQEAERRITELEEDLDLKTDLHDFQRMERTHAESQLAALSDEKRALEQDKVRIDWVEQNLLREGEIRRADGADKVRTWSVVTALPATLRETIDLLREKFSH